MTSDKIQPGKHNADDAQGEKSKSEKSKIEDALAKLAVTKLYDELFMPPQYRKKPGNAAQEALGMFFSLEQAKNNALKKDTHARVPSASSAKPPAKPPVTPGEASRDKSPGLPFGPMAWITEGEGKVRNKLDAVGGFIGGKANVLGHSLNNAAKQAGIPKEVRDATRATIEFTSHAAGAIVGDIHEMSKIVYNPHDPVVRFAESWGAKPAAFSTSIFRSGQNLVTGIAGLGSSGVSELGKRGFMQDPVKAMYLGNRDLFVNGAVEFGKWETRAKAGDWGSLAGHGATFFVGVGEAVAGAKAVRAISQGKSLGEAAAVFSESSNVAKAGKATTKAVDKATEQTGKKASHEVGSTAAENAGDKLAKGTSDKVSAPEKTVEDLSQISRQLEEARQIHKELSRQLVQKQKKLEEVNDKRELVSRVLEKQENSLNETKQNLLELGDSDKGLIVTDEQVRLSLRRSALSLFGSPLFDSHTSMSRIEAKLDEIEQTMSRLGLTKDPSYDRGKLRDIFPEDYFFDKRLKLPEQEFKQALLSFGVKIDEKDLWTGKSSSGLKEKQLTQEMPHSMQPSQELELLLNDTEVLRQKLNESKAQLANGYRELNAEEKLLRARNLEHVDASARYNHALHEWIHETIHLDYAAVPQELDKIQTLAEAETRSTGAIWEEATLKLSDGTTMATSIDNIEIKMPDPYFEGKFGMFEYDFETGKLSNLDDMWLLKPDYVKIKQLLVQNKMNLLNERLKLIAQNIVDGFDARPNQTVPEDYYSF